MMASKTRVPVIGVPVQTKALSGVDSLYSIVQMPRGYPVATMAIGAAGAANAGLMAAAILATNDDALAERLDTWREALSASIPEAPAMTEPLPSGSTIGILGGGQLGRMLSVAASRLGYRTHIYEPGAAPAADVSAAWTQAPMTISTRSAPSRGLRRHHLRVREHPRRRARCPVARRRPLYPTAARWR
jgi:hypothetical protein